MKQIYSIDLNQDKSRENSYLSETLLSKIKSTLEKKEKILLYLNKRGNFSSYICNDCNYISHCPNCDLSLNIHSHPERLICHHCFYEEELNLECKECQSVNMQKVWVWTAQIELSIQKLFPSIEMYRFDTDTLKNVSDKKKALNMLDSADLIIGTKMITTGFNIRNIGLIWVILVEQELNIPRYNNEEQIYFNLRQLLGRGGRVWQKTDIVLQTYAMKNPIIQSISEANYKEFFLSQLQERKLFWYPPYFELVYIIYRHKNKQDSLQFMQKFYHILDQDKSEKQSIILVDTPIKRNNQYFSKILIKWEKLREFLEPFRWEILKNSNLSVCFET